MGLFRPISVLLGTLAAAGLFGCGGGNSTAPPALSTRSDALTANSTALSSGTVATIYRFTANSSGNFQISMNSPTLSCHLLETKQLPFPATQVTNAAFVAGTDATNGQSILAVSVTAGMHCYVYATTRIGSPSFGSYTIGYPPGLTLDETITSVQ